MGQPGKATADVGSVIADYMSTTLTPGVAVALVAADNPDVGDGYVTCAGFADSGKSIPVEAETVFAIGSLTKVFTATLTALAVVRGNANLTDPVAPALSIYQPSPGPSSGFSAVQLLQLATHTAGIPDLAPCTGGASQYLFDDESPDQDSQLLDYWAGYQQPSSGLPACWTYSNTAFVTLGFAVSALFGETSNVYNELLATNVTTPLGLTSTTAHPGVPMATGFIRHGNTVSPTSSQTIYDLKSTGADMLRFVQASLGTASNPIPADLQAAITSTHADHGTFQICKTTNKMAMGLAWQHPVVAIGNQRVQVQYKNGAVTGFNCAAVLVPEQHAGVAVLANLAHPDDDSTPGTTRLAYELLDEVLQPLG